MIRPNPRHPRRRGSQAIEFALMATLILVPALSVVVDGSWYLYQQGRVVQAARDGARAGSEVDYDDADTVAQDAANDSLTAMGITGCTTVTGSTATSVYSERTVTVEVECPAITFIGLPDYMPSTHKATAVYRVQDPFS